MEYFPTFDDENDEETENNNIVVQNGGNGIIGILSNLFRPSGSSSRVVDIQQQEENRQNENEDSKEFELNSNGITNGGKMRTERQILPPSRSAESEQKLFRYTKSDFRRYWMPDSSGTVCYECNEKFSTFRRRHHCRLCGQIFCKNCANRTLDGTDFGYYGILRLCNYCADQMQIQIQSKNRPKDKIKLFLDNKMNDVSYRDIQINGEIDFISQNTSKEAFQSHFFLQPSSSELGLKHAITINPAGQDASNNLSHPSQEDSKNKNQQLLEQMFEKKMEKIFEGLLLREKLCTKSWKFLMQLSRVVADKITPLNLATSETQNPLDFTHIKKIHIDMEPTYELINGVGFNKSLAHSAMPILMKNVSLMLLNGTISYERILEKFSSIEPIIQQECQFFRNSCDRVRSAHISLMISEMPVPIAFMDLLIKEGISLITDVKMSVLKRISSATGADILNSLDAQFLQPRVGFVADFSQREFQTFTQQSKRIILMENCADGNFGPTILLKGRNMRELIAAKRILRYLILARYSSILEIAFLSLFNSLPKGQFSNNTLCHICELNQRNSGKDENEMEIENQSETEFMALFKQTQLTNSPAIHFSPPYLETPLGRQCSLLPYFKLPLFHYLVPTDCIKVQEQKEKECARFETLNAEEREKKAENAQMGHRMVDSRMGGKFKKLLNEKAWSNFRSTSALNFRQKFEFNQKAREETLLKLNDLLLESEMETIRLNKWANLDVLDPINHQGIAFLFGANSRKNRQNASEFCVGPFLFYRSFYDKNKDVSLGKFLINFCFNPEYKCSLKGCERPMLDHFRRIVHRNTRIELTTHNVVGTNRNSTPLLGPFGTSSSSALTNASALDGADGIFSLDELPSSIPNNNCQQMICWLRCNSCSANSSIVPMNDAVFHLSFAKFIDYLANGYHFVAPFPSSIDFHQCVHCTFHMHSHFFALGNYIACFRVSPIYPLNVVFSPIPCALGTSQKEDICEIREIQDAKGTHMIDVGSIIAHAFNSEEYSNKIAAVEEAKHNPTILQPDLIEIVHSDEKHHYSVKMHFPEQFKQFRSLIFFDGEKKYIHSLSNASAWFPQGGKSGASFLRTSDERFVLKTLSRFELESIKNYALKYIDYVSLAALEHKLTALCKIYGVYGITYTNKQNGQTVKNEYLVMEYLFYKKDIKQIWDLKGSLRNRLASTKPSNNLNTDSPSSSVLLDENYIQDLWRNQMYLTSHSKAALQQAISSDSDFLAQQGIMDYSLLAGISRGQEDEVIIGIVDYMRTFTIDKKVESLVKTALPLSNSPTVISPESYRDRFLERIKGYFQIAPDQWLFTNEA